MPDNDNQYGAKTQAAEIALEFVLSQYGKTYDSDPKYKEHRKFST